ncbi:MAG: FG-GAP repeat domain-containing protein [Planctomycetota bacterium]|jgi:hypothetical protein
MLRISCFLSLAALALSPLASAQQFVRDAAAIPAQTIWTDGVELVDVDADGDIDILFANGSSYGGTGTQGAQPQHLFKNNGSGLFSEAHTQLNVTNFNAKMVIAEDFDNDGDPDLFYASGSAGFTPRILINDGTGVFANESGTRLPTFSPNPRSFGCAAGDIDNDGDMDITLSDGGTFSGIASQVKLLLNDGTGNFTDVTTTQLPADLYNCQDITMLDFDGDYDIDICMSGKGGTGKRGRLYLNDGTGNFSINGAMNGLGTGATYEIDWGDFDGDNDFDAAVQSIAGQNEGWGENIGLAALMLESTFPSPNGQDDNEMACVDYDNDGDLDVFVASLQSSGEKVYRNNGGGSWTNNNAAIQTITDSTLDFGFADLDGDGAYDMVTGQGESGNWTNKIYFNNGPADTLPPKLMGANVPHQRRAGLRLDHHGRGGQRHGRGCHPHGWRPVPRRGSDARRHDRPHRGRHGDRLRRQLGLARPVQRSAGRRRVGGRRLRSRGRQRRSAPDGHGHHGRRHAELGGPDQRGAFGPGGPVRLAVQLADAVQGRHAGADPGAARRHAGHLGGRRDPAADPELAGRPASGREGLRAVRDRGRGRPGGRVVEQRDRRHAAVGRAARPT